MSRTSGVNAIASSATVALADRAKQLIESGASVIDLSAGRAPEHTPQAICDAAAKAMSQGQTHQTPARGTREFLTAVSEKLRRENGLERDPDSEIIATAGCKQGLTLALAALLSPGDEVVVEDPCFVSYAPTIQMLGGTAVQLRQATPRPKEWDADALEAALSPRTKALLICNPHNPTGDVATLDRLNAVARIAQDRGLYVLSDEVYERVVWRGEHRCIAGLEGMRDRTVTLMGMTKSYSMGGWRIGFAFAGREVTDAMVRAQQHLLTCTGSISQAAAAYAMSAECSEAMRPLWSSWRERVEYTCNRLAGIAGLECAAPDAGFYAWVDIRQTGLSSAAFASRLLDESLVCTVPGSAFGPSGEGWVRFTAVKETSVLDQALSRTEGFCQSVVEG